MLRQILIVKCIFLFLGQDLYSQNNSTEDCKSYLKNTVLIDSINVSNNTIKLTDLKKVKRLISPYAGQTIISFSYILNGAGIDCDGPTPIQVLGDNFSAKDLKYINKLIKGNLLIIFCVKVKTQDKKYLFLPTAIFEIE